MKRASQDHLLVAKVGGWTDRDIPPYASYSIKTANASDGTDGIPENVASMIKTITKNA